MKYKVEFDGRSFVGNREKIETGDYDIVKSRIAKTQILIYFNDFIFFRADDVQCYREPRNNMKFKWNTFDIEFTCIPEKDELF